MKKPTYILLFIIAGALAFSLRSDADSSLFHMYFTYHAIDGPVAVHSDISDEFTKKHAHHARLVWDYYQKTFSRSPGNRIVLYYTKNQNLYDKILKKHPTIVLKGARQLTVNWEKDHREWFIMPYTDPDYGTQLHEISHDFLYCTCPGMDHFPWFREGSAMYYESGTFNDKGELVINEPLPSYHQLFRDWSAKNKLIPLNDLLYMPKNDFYQADYTKTYSQSMIFFFYLTKEHPETMKEVFAGINNQKITSNEQLVSFITKSTGRKVAEMEREYIEYGTTAWDML